MLKHDFLRQTFYVVSLTKDFPKILITSLTSQRAATQSVRSLSSQQSHKTVSLYTPLIFALRTPSLQPPQKFAHQRRFSFTFFQKGFELGNDIFSRVLYHLSHYLTNFSSKTSTGVRRFRMWLHGFFSYVYSFIFVLLHLKKKTSL